MNYYIIGCGGVATYFLPAFLKTLKHHKSFKKSSVYLVDGDYIENKNYSRQVFDAGMENVNKAEALCRMYANSNYIENLTPITDYITESFMPEFKSMLIGFVDNHPARKDILTVADRNKCKVLFAANSTIGAQAMYYDPDWCNTSMDPRIRYPEILTTERGSPVHAVGCNTEEKLDETPQTAIANQLAATHALHLWNFWSIECKKLDPEQSFNFWPIESNNTFTKFYSVLTGDLTKNE